MNGAAIVIEDLLVTAGGSILLRVDRLEVPAGRICAVLGPNGAGKTTLLRTCLGLQRPAAGRVTVLGEPLHRLGSSQLCRLRRRIGYVPQALSRRSQMPLTVREVVAIGRTGIAGLFRPLRRDDWRIVDEWIGRMGLSALAGRGYGQISGGEQRKALIARAMVQQPRLLLLDEPTAFLDLHWREQIVATLQGLYERTGVTAVLVCHELEVLPPGCDDLVLLENGRVVDRGEPAAVLTTRRVASLYGPGLTVRRSGGRFAVVPGGKVQT